MGPQRCCSGSFKAWIDHPCRILEHAPLGIEGASPRYYLLALLLCAPWRHDVAQCVHCTRTRFEELLLMIQRASILRSRILVLFTLAPDLSTTQTVVEPEASMPCTIGIALTLHGLKLPCIGSHSSFGLQIPFYIQQKQLSGGFPSSASS